MPALSPDLMEKMDAYWRAANHLSVGQVYLQDNPLLESPLERKHLGVWKTGPEMIPLSHDPSSIHHDGADHRIGTRRAATFRRQAQGRHHISKILRAVYPPAVTFRNGTGISRIRQARLSPDANGHRFLRDLEEGRRTVRADAAAFAPFLASASASAACAAASRAIPTR